MEMKKVFTAFLALSVGLVACNKSDDLIGPGPDSSESKIVALSVSNQTITKALTDGIEMDHEVEFNGGYIVFTTGNDRITDVFYLTNDDTDPAIATPADTLTAKGTLNTILIEDIEDNYFFKVNSDAQYVHVFGNTDNHSLAFNSNSNGPIDSYLSNFPVAVTDLLDDDNAVKNVPLYGVGPIQNYSDGPGEFSDQFSGDVEKIAEVEIKPIASRLELAKITAATGADSNSHTITGYKLEAIFLNYFHTGMSYDGNQESSTGFVAFNSMDDFDQDGSSTGPWYDFVNRGKFYDFGHDNIAAYTHPATTPNYTPSAGATAVWAYNMFQAKAENAADAQDALPHLVLKLKDVTVTGTGATFDQEYYYITVRRYKEQGTNNYISAFEGGYVYYIQDIEFYAENLKEVPEWREPMDVEVMFKVMKWQNKAVDVDLD
ncbi:MAG: hypothetical protein LIP06_02920 [Tannerellaceae bacterium]|nr:hypothetical protein [Tannerellaceae bacterium]